MPLPGCSPKMKDEPGPCCLWPCSAGQLLSVYIAWVAERNRSAGTPGPSRCRLTKGNSTCVFSFLGRLRCVRWAVLDNVGDTSFVLPPQSCFYIFPSSGHRHFRWGLACDKNISGIFVREDIKICWWAFIDQMESYFSLCVYFLTFLKCSMGLCKISLLWMGEVLPEFVSRACCLWTLQYAICASSRENLLLNRKGCRYRVRRPGVPSGPE